MSSMEAAPRRSRRANPLGGVLFGFVMVLSLVGGWAAGWLATSEVAWAGITQTINPLDNRTVGETLGLDREWMTILVLGVDEDRAYRGPVTNDLARSDTMMLLRLDFERNTVGGVSIPRDTLAKLPGYATQKITNYHRIGGKPLAERAVEELVGVEVDRTIRVNYEAFQEMVDLVGGVTVEVDKRMLYTDRRGELFIDLQEGVQKLDGYDAMGFVRFRQDRRGDLTRVERQRKFLVAYKDALLASPTKLPAIADRSVELADNEFEPAEVARLARWAVELDSSAINIGTLPVVDVPNNNLRVIEGELPNALVEFGLTAPLTASTERSES